MLRRASQRMTRPSPPGGLPVASEHVRKRSPDQLSTKVWRDVSVLVGALKSEDNIPLNVFHLGVV